MTWLPGTSTLEDIDVVQPMSGQLGDWVDAATQLGVAHGDRIFSAGVLRLDDFQRWRATDVDYAELIEHRGVGIGGLEAAWTDGPTPPPIIVVRYADGDMWGIDG